MEGCRILVSKVEGITSSSGESVGRVVSWPNMTPALSVLAESGV